MQHRALGSSTCELISCLTHCPPHPFSILFVETSAKTGHNVRHAFESCVREIHKRFVASQSSASASSSESNKLLKSRTGGKGRGADGQIRLDQDGGIMTRSGCCTVM